MWFSKLRAKRQEEKMRFLNAKETQVMHLLWTEEKDLSVYGIQEVMHRVILSISLYTFSSRNL